MRHLQPSSFSDIMELLPGGLSKEPEMGAVNTIKLRLASGTGTGDDYSTASLGTYATEKPCRHPKKPKHSFSRSPSP